MTEQEREDLLTLKLIVPEIKNSLNRILENQDVLTKIKLEVDENKAFRNEFNNEVARIVSQRLNTIQFEKELNAQIEKQTELYLNKQNVRDEFSTKVDSIVLKWLKTDEFVNRVKKVFIEEFKHIQLSLYFKLTAIVGSVATALVIFILKGVLGDK